MKGRHNHGNGVANILLITVNKVKQLFLDFTNRTVHEKIIPASKRYYCCFRVACQQMINKKCDAKSAGFTLYHNSIFKLFFEGIRMNYFLKEYF